MSERKIIISVVVATYRRKEQLSRALDSLSRQSFLNFEIVLVDDNVDSEWNRSVSEIHSDFCRKHPLIPIRLIVNDNPLGSAGSRNAGILAAAGEYVTFLDDDDIYLPEKLEHQIHCMRQSSADYSLTDLILYNEDDQPVDVRIRYYLKNAKPDDLLVLHMIHHMTGTDTIMMRREYLFQIGLFDGIDIGDEYYLMQKAIQAGGRFCYVPYCDLKAYVHDSDVGLSSGEKKIDGENQLYAFKRKSFSRLNAKSRRLIKMRHYSVLGYTNLRMRRIGKAIGCGVCAAAASPFGLIQLLRRRKK